MRDSGEYRGAVKGRYMAKPVAELKGTCGGGRSPSTPPLSPGLCPGKGGACVEDDGPPVTASLAAAAASWFSAEDAAADEAKTMRAGEDKGLGTKVGGTSIPPEPGTGGKKGLGQKLNRNMASRCRSVLIISKNGLEVPAEGYSDECLYVFLTIVYFNDN